jgi:membrane protease YdiL (CAAX protease family)
MDTAPTKSPEHNLAGQAVSPPGRCPWTLIFGGGLAALLYGLLGAKTDTLLLSYPRSAFFAYVALSLIPCVALGIARQLGWQLWSFPARALTSPLSKKARHSLWFLGLAAVACIMFAAHELKTDPQAVKLARLLANQVPHWAASALPQHEFAGFLWLGGILICRCLLAPWFEELFFRALLFAGVRSQSNTLFAWLLSGLLFCGYQTTLWMILIDNWDPREFKRVLLGLFVFHTVGCRLLARGQSVVPAIAFHSLWNLLMTGAQLAVFFAKIRG